MRGLRWPAGRGLGLRTRLTLVYGGLFLVSSAVLEAATYLVTARAVTTDIRVSVSHPDAGPTNNVLISSPPAFVSQLERQQRAVLDQLTTSAVLTLVALVVLSLLLGYWVSGRMLRPLRQMTVTARRLSESTLHERIALAGPDDEIKELADTFDRLFERLDRAFDSQRRFIANAAHELRTPLAINRAAIDVALAKPGGVPESTRVLGGRLLVTLGRQEQLLDGLLLLAQSERELRHRAPVDLAAVASAAVEQLVDQARQSGLELSLRADPAPALGDPVLLERCAVNLVENAVKYNVAGGRIEVSTGADGGRSFLRVENTGRPVTPAQALTVFEPFRRLNGDRLRSARGAGLGLSIVRAVLHAHEGEATAVPRPGGGLVLDCRLPTAGDGGDGG